MNETGNKIAELRKQANMTQGDLAKALKISRQTVSQWELGLSLPKTDMLKSLCEFFNVKPDYLIFENSSMQPLVPVQEDVELMPQREIAASAPTVEVIEVKPEKPSRKKKIIIITAVIIALIAAGIMLFIAWLETPTYGSSIHVSSSSWNFDIVTVLQILAGVLLFVVACIVVAAIIKYVKNRKK